MSDLARKGMPRARNGPSRQREAAPRVHFRAYSACRTSRPVKANNHPLITPVVGDDVIDIYGFEFVVNEAGLEMIDQGRKVVGPYSPMTVGTFDFVRGVAVGASKDGG